MSSSNENELLYNQAVRIGGLIHKIRERQPLQGGEQQELNNWLNNSESNRKLFELLHDREQLSTELEALMKYDENNAVTTIFNALGERPPPAVNKAKLIWRFSIAASLLLLIGAASWFFIGRSGSARGNGAVAYKTFTTPRGKQDRLTLADGSEVWLNAASSIRYPTSFNGNTREVTITGEAWFSVAKDKTKPFIVTAGAMKVQVVGTEFDVMAYSDEDVIRTTLINGTVKASSIKQGQELTLQPGEQAALVQQSGLMHVEKPNLDEVTGWRTGKLSFHETDMATIMRQVARWYDVNVVYRSDAANIGFTGQLSRKKNIKELLDILSGTRKVHFEIKDDKTIVVIPGPK